MRTAIGVIDLCACFEEKSGPNAVVKSSEWLMMLFLSQSDVQLKIRTRSLMRQDPLWLVRLLSLVSPHRGKLLDAFSIGPRLLGSLDLRLDRRISLDTRQHVPHLSFSTIDFLISTFRILCCAVAHKYHFFFMMFSGLTTLRVSTLSQYLSPA